MMKPIYKSKDGTEHETADAAARHNKLLVATQELREAADRVRKCLGATALTADGEPFDMSHSRDYWCLHQAWPGMPRLEKVWFWPHNCLDVETDRENGGIMLRDSRSDERRQRVYRVSELYADERNARAALLAACKERLAELTDEVAKMEATEGQP